MDLDSLEDTRRTLIEKEPNNILCENEIKKAENIVNEMVEEYIKFIQTSEINPILKELRQKAEEISKDVITNAVKKKFIKEEDEKAVEKIVHTAFKRFLHNPTITLKQNANDPQIDILLSSIKKLFKIDEDLMDINRCEYHNKG